MPKSPTGELWALLPPVDEYEPSKQSVPVRRRPMVAAPAAVLPLTTQPGPVASTWRFTPYASSVLNRALYLLVGGYTSPFHATDLERWRVVHRRVDR